MKKAIRMAIIVLAAVTACALICAVMPSAAKAADERPLPTAPGSVLTSGTYVVSQNTTINGRDCQSALIVSGDVTIMIEKGVTLTVRGGNASGMTGAGAGIELPEGSSLMIGGSGKIEATGGSASKGEYGRSGGNASVWDDEDPKNPHFGTDWCENGWGGAGGNGGGGAGAGIGGKGGNGGNGGEGGWAYSIKADGDAPRSGWSGSSGKSGTNGGNCGSVTICGSVTCDIAGGSAYKDIMSGGGYGDYGWYQWFRYYLAFGGGGGGAGGNGYPGAKIGNGGAGGGGGGGGGSGIITRWVEVDDFYDCWGYGYGGNGGEGYGGNGGKGLTGYGPNNTDGFTPGYGGDSGKAGSNGAGVEKTVTYLTSVKIPQPQKRVYNGWAQKMDDDDASYMEYLGCYTISGDYYTADVGNYTAYITISKGYCWEDGTIDTKTFEWSIEKRTVSLPTVVSFCYTGYEIVFAENTDRYTVENGKATAVDHYKATLKLRDPKNNRWENSDDATIALDYDIHEFEDDGSGKCKKCGGDTPRLFGVPYLDRTIGSDDSVVTGGKTCSVATCVHSDDTAWGEKDAETWYVSSGEVTVNNRIDIVGHVHLILKDGCTLTAKSGIHLADNNVLSVYAQSDGESRGKLVATGDGTAAIGGNNGKNGYSDGGHNYRAGSGENCGILNVYGGDIVADGKNSAGIGGGRGGNGLALSGFAFYTTEEQDGEKGGSGGVINLYSGSITATGFVGIGGGNGGDGGHGNDLYDYVKLYKYIGGNGGTGGAGSQISVYGGTLKASGNFAGIGGGNGGNGGDYTTYCPSDGRQVVYEDGWNFGGNGGAGGTLSVIGGRVILSGKTKAAGGGNGGNPGRNGENGLNGAETTFSYAKDCKLKAGEDEQTAGAVPAYKNEKYLSVVSGKGTGFGSLVSGGNWWIIAVSAAIIVGSAVAIVIVYKKKKEKTSVQE